MEFAKHIILDFTGVFSSDSSFPEGSRVIDFTSLEGTNCYCDPEAAEAIRAAVADLPVGAVHWIDTGDYHYLTYFWLEKITRPFALLLLDNHPDDQPPAFSGILSCGGWVADAGRDFPLMQSLADGIPVYISIDKDILSRDFARTDWDQGEMTLDELFGILRDVASSHEILGIDVCGGLTESKGGRQEDIRINRAADAELRKFLLTLKV